MRVMRRSLDFQLAADRAATRFALSHLPYAPVVPLRHTGCDGELCGKLGDEVDQAAW